MRKSKSAKLPRQGGTPIAVEPVARARFRPRSTPPQHPSFAQPFEAAIVWRELGALVPNPRNARTHGSKQVQQIAASIKQFGFTNPILIDGAGTILAGHGRMSAAKALGMERVPTIRLDRLTAEQKRAYALADNRLAELAGWDRSLLAIELQELAAIDLDFDIEITGFETGDIDLLIDSLTGSVPDPADQVSELDTSLPPISRPGDLWFLGPHRLLCADALQGGSYELLLDGAKAQMVFTDPPYNVPISGHVCGSGRIRHREFAMAAGELSETEFIGFLTRVCTHLAAHSQAGSVHFICMDWRHAYELLSATRTVYSELKNLCVWNKDNAGMGSFYRSKHELVFVFKHGSAKHQNNFLLGQHGRYRTNVWDYPGVNTLRPGRMDDLAMHPTVKPVAMVADAIRDCSKRGGVVLDPFAGSGTLLIAASRTGRVGQAMELDPLYVDVAIRRWEAFSGEHAKHAGTGFSLTELARSRGLDVNVEQDRRHKEVPHGA